jgi:hypothetical protein
MAAPDMKEVLALAEDVFGLLFERISSAKEPNLLLNTLSVVVANSIALCAENEPDVEIMLGEFIDQVRGHMPSALENMHDLDHLDRLLRRGLH